jgi:hypothetical protein
VIEGEKKEEEEEMNDGSWRGRKNRTKLSPCYVVPTLVMLRKRSLHTSGSTPLTDELWL